MRVLPRNKQEWIDLILFPFKAYVVVAYVWLQICARLQGPRHYGGTEAEAIVALGFFPCSLVLLMAAAIMAVVGPRGAAIPNAIFGGVAFVIVWASLPVY